MHDPERPAVVVAQTVRVRQPAQRVGDHAQPDRRAEAADAIGAEQGAQREPLDMLHRDEVGAALLADLVGVHEIGVVEPQRQPRLVEEDRELRGIAGELGAGALDHDQLVDPERAARDREEHLSLAAAA